MNERQERAREKFKEIQKTRPLQVVVVDDSDDICKTLKVVLEADFNCEVETTHSCIEALSWMRKAPVDCVLLDDLMERYDGADCFHMIRQKWPEVEVIFITGYSDGRKEVRKCIQEPALGIITKPIAIRDLAEYFPKL